MYRMQGTRDAQRLSLAWALEWDMIVSGALDERGRETDRYGTYKAEVVSVNLRLLHYTVFRRCCFSSANDHDAHAGRGVSHYAPEDPKPSCGVPCINTVNKDNRIPQSFGRVGTPIAFTVLRRKATKYICRTIRPAPPIKAHIHGVVEEMIRLDS